MEPKKENEALLKALTAKLPVESPEELSRMAAEIESLSYFAVAKQAEAEQKLNQAEYELNLSKREEIPGKTAADRKTNWEGKTAEITKKIADAKTESMFWRNVGRLIENKVSLSQSVLANITSMVKAGIRR